MCKLKSIILTLCCVLSFGVLSAQDTFDINDASRGNVSEYRDNYVPVEYSSLPEFMSFVDVAVLLALLVVGMVFVIKRKSSKKMNILMLITFIYLGLIRGGCICPVGSISNVTLGIIQPALVSLVALIIFLGPLVISLVSGRSFCSSACPLGAVQNLNHTKKHKKWLRLPSVVNKFVFILPIIALAITIYSIVGGSGCFFICKLDPYKPLLFTGNAWFDQIVCFIKGMPAESRIILAGGVGAWIYMVLVLALGYFFPRPFCRFICPYSVLLGVISLFAVKRREIDKSSCVYCSLCSKVCPMQAITIDRANKVAKVSQYNCIQCNRCTESCRKGAI